MAKRRKKADEPTRSEAVSEEPRQIERWSTYRWKQAEELRRLLVECSLLNRSTSVIERMQRIIKAAEKLLGHRRNRGKTYYAPLMTFIEAHARHDYEAQQRNRKPKPVTTQEQP